MIILQSVRDSATDIDIEEHRMKLFEYRVNKALSLYLPPLFLLIGTFGNTFAFLILRNKTMTRQSTNLFLAALAVTDSIVLFVGLLRKWLTVLLGINIQNESVWTCKGISVLGYANSQFSVWLIIAVTIERYIVVSQPLHASRFCNMRRAKRVITLLGVVFLLLNIHFLWTVTIVQRAGHGGLHCDPIEQYKTLVAAVWPWIDATLYALLPSLLIVIFNTLIIFQTVRATTWRDDAQKGPMINTEKRKTYKDNNVKLTVMLLSVSFTFLVTTFPMAIVMVFHDEWKRQNTDQLPVQVIAQRQLIRTIAEMLMYLNHSINFYLYCALGQKFRNQVLKTLCRRTLSNTSNVSDHSQHLYCSRVNGYHQHKCSDETAL